VLVSERRGTAIADPQALGYALLHTASDRRSVMKGIEKVLLIARQRNVDPEIEKVVPRTTGYEPAQRPLAGREPRRFVCSRPWKVSRDHRWHNEDDWDVRHASHEGGKLFNRGKLNLPLGNWRSLRRFVQRWRSPELAVAEQLIVPVAIRRARRAQAKS